MESRKGGNKGTIAEKTNGRDSCESPAIGSNPDRWSGYINYLEAEAEAMAAEASAEADAFLCFLCFLAGLAEASPEAMAAEADAIAEPEAAGAELWLAAKAETENRPATRAAINLFMLILLKISWWVVR